MRICLQTIQMVEDPKVANCQMSVENLENSEDAEVGRNAIEIPAKPNSYTKLGISIDQLQDVAYELGLINLTWEQSEELKLEGSYPQSYRINHDKEKLLLWYAENFRRQYHFVYVDRKPLLLAAENECGTQKMVCTAIRPTMLPYPEFYTWQGCAKFVADHITYKSLDRTTSIPRTLFSPWTVIQRQEGHCFELSTLLVSYLVGSGYEAYVVYGYATLEVSTNDQTRTVCPLLEVKEEEKEEAIEEDQPKYVIKPPKDLRSQFILEMEARELQKIEEEKKQALDEETKMIEDLERAPPDPLFACRVHSWVVVLPGKRDVKMPFFIEPTTGVGYEISSTCYLGLESLWDHRNYWVNLQPCTNGCQDLDFNLSDVGKWEHLLVSEPWLPSRKEVLRKELEEEDKLADKHLDMPFSWSMKPSIPLYAYEKRFPGGTKTIRYKKSVLECFAPYYESNGLVTRIMVFEDYNWTNPLRIDEYYKNRKDLLVFSRLNINSEMVIEQFDEGRDDALKEHIHTLKRNSVENFHKMTFYYKSRYDGLELITLQALQMTEEFKDRSDFLYYRNADYGNRIRIKSVSEDAKRPILNVIERYHQNANQSPSKNVRELHFALSENKIKISYQYEKGKITAATREFTKPDVGEIVFSAELTKGFNADFSLPPEKQLDLYYLLKELLDREEKTLLHLRDIEDEMASLLKLRVYENESPGQNISIFDVERNLEAREGLKEKELQRKQECDREVEDVVDYLAPYLARLGNPAEINKQQALQIRDDCLSDYRKLLSERVDKIQKILKLEKHNLSEKQKWFEENQQILTRAEKEAYSTYCSNTMFHICTIEMRLQKHQAQFSIRMRKLENDLKNDSRLSILYQ